MMHWGDEPVGLVLSRNEIWLLLHALTAGPRPSVGWDGSCAERGWGAQVSIPLGATQVTPADAAVTTRNANGEPQVHTGLERPVVALARAFIAAWMEMSQFGGAERLDVGPDHYVIYLDSVGPGDKPETIERMKRQGWELVLDETGQPEARLIFRNVQKQSSS